MQVSPPCFGEAISGKKSLEIGGVQPLRCSKPSLSFGQRALKPWSSLKLELIDCTLPHRRLSLVRCCPPPTGATLTFTPCNRLPLLVRRAL